MRIILSLLFCLSFTAHGSETVEGAKKDYQVFKEEMSVKLNELDKKIEQLKLESKQKGKAIQEASLKELEQTRDQLRSDLDAAKEASASKWSQFKKGFAKSVDNLNTKIQKVLKE